MQAAHLTLLRSLTMLRAFAAAGQALAIALTLWLLELPLNAMALWAGVLMLLAGVLAALMLQPARSATTPALLGWLAFDSVVLTWQLWWSGGMMNPFVSLYLVPIALAAVSLPLRWTVACALFCAGGYAVLVWSAPALPHVHGAPALFDLHLWGMVVNFGLTAVLFVLLLARLVSTLRSRDLELAQLREQQARNEGIVALGMQAASLAHELNTPLGTLRLLSAELRETGMERGFDASVLDSIDQVIDVCRDRIRALVASCDPGRQEPVVLQDWLEQTLQRWALLHPQINLQTHSAAIEPLRIRPDVRLTHLLHALLDNGAQASLAHGKDCIEVSLRCTAAILSLSIRDHGNGLSAHPFTPGTLFATSKVDGLGLGLALSQATVEWLGGQLELLPQVDGGVLCKVEVSLQRLLAESDPVEAP